MDTPRRSATRKNRASAASAAPSASKAASPEALRDFSRSLPMALLRTREAVMARFRPMLRSHDLTEQQWRVLRALTAASTPLRFGEVAAHTCISLPSLSRLLKTLETRGYVRRAALESDLRAAQITASRSGAALVERIAPLAEARYAEITAAIGVPDTERLYRLLANVAERLGDDARPAADD